MAAPPRLPVNLEKRGASCPASPAPARASRGRVRRARPGNSCAGRAVPRGGTPAQGGRGPQAPAAPPRRPTPGSRSPGPAARPRGRSVPRPSGTQEPETPSPAAASCTPAASGPGPPAAVRSAAPWRPSPVPRWAGSEGGLRRPVLPADRARISPCVRPRAPVLWRSRRCRGGGGGGRTQCEGDRLPTV